MMIDWKQRFLDTFETDLMLSVGTIGAYVFTILFLYSICVFVRTYM